MLFREFVAVFYVHTKHTNRLWCSSLNIWMFKPGSTWSNYWAFDGWSMSATGDNLLELRSQTCEAKAYLLYNKYIGIEHIVC